MRCAKIKPIICAAFMLPLAAGMSHSARAGLAEFEGRLPLEPRLPDRTVICSTLQAGLSEAAFATPTTTDPDVDSIAAVTANPASSNPDTARIQAALDSCHAGGVVKLAASAPNGPTAHKKPTFSCSTIHPPPGQIQPSPSRI